MKLTKTPEQFTRVLNNLNIELEDIDKDDSMYAEVGRQIHALKLLAMGELNIDDIEPGSPEMEVYEWATTDKWVELREQEGLYEFMWCLHCERAYKYGEHRVKHVDGLMGKQNTLKMCPYTNCDGDTVIDSKPWDWVRHENPQYPETPDPDVYYPYYT